MARFRASLPPPTLSVLDRLVDDDPGFQESEVPLDYQAGLTRLRVSVLRNLSAVLNARIGLARAALEPQGRRATPEDDVLDRSVVRWGLPDITNLDLKISEEQDELRRRILLAIEWFEPRLTHVKVTVGESLDQEGRTRFFVEARLAVDPEPLAVAFDAMVVWRNRQVEVE